jgi:hypothetical protein
MYNGSSPNNSGARDLSKQAVSGWAHWSYFAAGRTTLDTPVAQSARQYSRNLQNQSRPIRKVIFSWSRHPSLLPEWRRSGMFGTHQVLRVCPINTINISYILWQVVARMRWAVMTSTASIIFEIPKNRLNERVWPHPQPCVFVLSLYYFRTGKPYKTPETLR